jgi:hypothetical protein
MAIRPAKVPIDPLRAFIWEQQSLAPVQVPMLFACAVMPGILLIYLHALDLRVDTAVRRLVISFWGTHSPKHLEFFAQPA